MKILLQYKNQILMEELPRRIVRSGGWVPHELEEHRTNDATDLKHYSN